MGKDFGARISEEHLLGKNFGVNCLFQNKGNAALFYFSSVPCCKLKNIGAEFSGEKYWGRIFRGIFGEQFVENLSFFFSESCLPGNHFDVQYWPNVSVFVRKRGNALCFQRTFCMKHIRCGPVSTKTLLQPFDLQTYRSILGEKYLRVEVLGRMV